MPLVTISGKLGNVGTVVATPALPGAEAQQWICDAVVPALNPVKVTSTVIKFVVVSHVTNAVPVPFDVGCGGFSFALERPGAFGPVATNLNNALPVSVMLAWAVAFLPVAVSVAGSPTPDAVGAYRIVTAHDLFGPKLVPEHPSETTMKVAGPDNETVKSADADPPEFATVNVCDPESPSPPSQSQSFQQSPATS